MAAPRYLTRDGAEVSCRQTSLHHIWWIDKDYRPGAEQRFRNMSGFVLRLTNEVHQDLHAETFPPPKPSKQLREQIQDYSCMLYESNVYDEFYRLAQFIGDVANTSWSAERADEAFRIHENLVEQAAYVELGKVSPVYAGV